MKYFKIIYFSISFITYLYMTEQAQPQDITSNLEAHWTFDDYIMLVNEASSLDSSNRNRNAMVSAGVPFPVTGKVGNAVYMDGFSEFTAPWKGIGGDASRTIALWVRTNENGNAFVNWGTNATGQNWRFGIRGAAPANQPGPPPGTLSVDINGSGAFGRTLISTGEWVHVACVYSGGALHETRFYVNGVAEPASPPPPPDREVIPVNTNVNSGDSPDITIGNMEGRDGPVRITGSMDDIRIYSRALSADDIRAIFEKGNAAQNTAVRSFSQSSVEVGESITANILSPAISNAVLTEIVPNGWTITNVSGNGSVDHNIITWNNPSVNASYTISLNDGAAGNRFAGGFNGLVTSGEYEITILTEGAGTFTQTADTGNVQISGSASYNNGRYLAQGSGSGISGQEDSFRFLFKPLTGPFTIRGNAFVTPEIDDYINAVGGIMVRNDLTSNTSNAYLYLRGDLFMGAQARLLSGGMTNIIHDLVDDQFGDMEITRNGNYLEFFYFNTNGTKINLGQAQIEDLVDPVYAGLAVSSGNDDTLADLEMTHVEVIEEDFSFTRTIANSQPGRIRPGDTLTVTVDLFNRNALPIQLTEDVPSNFDITHIQTTGGTVRMDVSELLVWSIAEAGEYQLTYEIHIPDTLLPASPAQSEITHTFNSVINADSSTPPRVVGDNIIRIPLLLNEDDVVNQDITTGLDGYWTFNEGTGAIAADSSGNNRNAVVRDGSPDWVPGVQETALEFNGDDSIEIPGYYGISGNAPRTTSFWIRTPDPGRPHAIMVWGGLMEQGVKWDIHINSGEMGGAAGAARLDIFANFIAGFTNIADNNWHHVAVVLQEGGTVMSDALIYVDGFYDGVSGTDPINPNLAINTSGPGENSDVAVMGSRIDRGETQYYRGMLDEVRIYNHALAAEQIQSIYLTERPDTPPDTFVEDFMLYE